MDGNRGLTHAEEAAPVLVALGTLLAGVITGLRAQDSWSISTIRSQSATLSATTFGGGLWLAVGSNGVVLTSPDGVNWTSQTSGTTQGLRGAAYGSARFVVVGSSGTTTQRTSTGRRVRGRPR